MFSFRFHFSVCHCSAYCSLFLLRLLDHNFPLHRSNFPYLKSTPSSSSFFSSPCIHINMSSIFISLLFLIMTSSNPSSYSYSSSSSSATLTPIHILPFILMLSTSFVQISRLLMHFTFQQANSLSLPRSHSLCFSSSLFSHSLPPASLLSHISSFSPLFSRPSPPRPFFVRTIKRGRLRPRRCLICLGKKGKP